MASEAIRNAATSTAAGIGGSVCGLVDLEGEQVGRERRGALADRTEQSDLVDGWWAQFVDGASHLGDGGLGLVADLGQQSVPRVDLSRVTGRPRA